MADIFASNSSRVGASAAAGISSQWPAQTEASRSQIAEIVKIVGLVMSGNLTHWANCATAVLRAQQSVGCAQGRVKHVGKPFEELEDQMCDFGLGGLSSGRSPDRLDALVWAVTALNASAHAGPRITFF